MTRFRLFGSDVPFMDWCREKGKTGDLPAVSDECGWVQTDVDTFVHRYITKVDGHGTRDVQCMMEVEVKTRSGELTSSQLDTYRKKHATTLPRLIWNGQTLINYGISVLRLEGTSPEGSSWMKWGRFDRTMKGQIREEPISLQQLLGLLRFDLHPDTMEPTTFRRCEKTGRVLLVTSEEDGGIACEWLE